MPRRNSYLLLFFIVACLACAWKVSPYGRMLMFAMDEIEQRALEKVDRKELFEGAMKGMTDRLDTLFHVHAAGHGGRVRAGDRPAVRRRRHGSAARPRHRAAHRGQPPVRLARLRGRHPRRRPDPPYRRPEHAGSLARRRVEADAGQARRPRHADDPAHRPDRSRKTCRLSAPSSRSKACWATPATPTAPGTTSCKATTGSATCGSTRFSEQTADELQRSLEVAGRPRHAGADPRPAERPRRAAGRGDQDLRHVRRLRHDRLHPPARPNRIVATYAATAEGTYTDFPMAVLVNQLQRQRQRDRGRLSPGPPPGGDRGPAKLRQGDRPGTDQAASRARGR